MKRKVWGITVLTFGLLLISLPPGIGASNAPGGPCTKAGNTSKYGTTSVTCVKIGKKLLWQKHPTKKTIPGKTTVQSLAALGEAGIAECTQYAYGPCEGKPEGVISVIDPRYGRATSPVGTGYGGSVFRRENATSLTWTEAFHVSGGSTPCSIASTQSGVPKDVLLELGACFEDPSVTASEAVVGTASHYWTGVASSSDGSHLVAVEDSGFIYTSTNGGLAWVQHGPGALWTSVTSSSDGKQLYATAGVGHGNNGDHIYSSHDSGRTWTPHGTLANWFAIASSGDGKHLVAAIWGGQIYTSTNSGLTWIPRDSMRRWQTVASSIDGKHLVAAVSGGQIYISTDSGVTWTPRGSDRNWAKVASSNDGTHLVATALGDQIYTSTDSGVTWAPHGSGRNWTAATSSNDGTHLVAAAFSNQIYTSSDSGVTWTPRGPFRDWGNIASSSNGTHLIAVTSYQIDGKAAGEIYTSTDSGRTWKVRMVP